MLAGNTTHAQYCTPTYFQGCVLSGQINDFTLPGDAGSSITDLGTGCSSSGSTPPVTCYRDMSASMTVTLSAATSYTVATTTSGIIPTGIQMFIDFNDDSTFDASTETVGGGAYATIGTTNITITIPAAATGGAHRLRVVASDGTYPSITPCPSFSIPSAVGEVHDYTAVIVSSTLSCGDPTGLAATSVTSTSAVLNWTEPMGSAGSEYVVSTSAATPTGSGTATTALTYSPTGLTPSTVYYAFVRDSCAPANLSAWVSTTFTTTATSTQTKTTANDHFDLTAYPNPAKEILNISISGTVNTGANIALTDVTGKTVRSVKADANQLSLNTAGLPSGIYLIRYTDAMRTKTIRITKE